MRFLRSNTAVIVTVGPFYDKTDGVTIEGALTITNERITLTADTDAGSAPTIILDNITGATSGTANDLNYITGIDAGLMQLELAAADVNRVGRMFLSITDAANHVPVFHEFFVLPQAIFDWLTGVIVPLPANVTTWLGTAAATPTVAGVPEVDLTHVAGATTNVAALATNVDAILTDTAVIGAAGAGLTDLGGMSTTMKAQVQTEAEDALVVHRLDELLNADSDIDGAAPPTVGSVFHELMSKTAGSFTFDQTTDSNEAIRDRGDAAWITATGFATPTNITAGTITTVTNLTTNNDKTGYAIGTGGIAAAAFAAGAVDAAAIAADAIGASELAASAAEEIADALLNRNVAGGSNTGRLVKEGLYALRNRMAIAAGTLTVYQVNDTTASWTAAVTTAAGNPISEIDPS